MIKQFSNIKPKYEGKIEVSYDKNVLQSGSRLMKLLENTTNAYKKSKEIAKNIEQTDAMIQRQTRDLEYAYNDMSYYNISSTIENQRYIRNKYVEELKEIAPQFKQQMKELFAVINLSQKIIAKYGDKFMNKLKDFVYDISELFAASERVIELFEDNSCEHYDHDINIDLIKHTSYYIPKPLSKMSLCFLVEMDIFNDDVINYINKYNLKEDISSWYIYRKHKLPPINVIPRNPTSLKFIGCLMQIDPEFDLKSLYDKKMSFEFVSKLTDAFPDIDFDGLL